MPTPHADSVLTDADRKEIDEIFSVPPQTIAVEKLHELCARVFSENMTALNRLDINKNPADAKAQIKYIKGRHNEYFVLMHDYIYQSCQDQKSVEAWLRIANECQEKYNDMLGHAIRNALAKVIAEKTVALPTFADTILYKKIYSTYFPTFSITDDYRLHLLSSRKNAIAPALPFYLNHIEDSMKRDEDFTRIRDVKRLLTDDEWKLVTSSIAGKSESAIYEQIDRVLLNLGKSQHVSTLSDLFKEFNIDNEESLRRRFIKADNYFAEKNKLEPDPFITKYTSAINAKLVRQIPAAPAVQAVMAPAEPAPATVTKQNISRPQPGVNYEEELRNAKSEKEQYNAIRKKSALSDSEIKEAIRINNKLIHVYLRQRNACEERYAGNEIPANEYQLQASINNEIDALKMDNASLRKKLFKPEENKIDRQPTALQTAVIEVVIKPLAPVQEPIKEAVITKSDEPAVVSGKKELQTMKEMSEVKEIKVKRIDTSNSKFVFKRKNIPGVEKTENTVAADKPGNITNPEIVAAKPEIDPATDKKLK